MMLLRRAVDMMRKDLDSITEKGQAVVRLNQQLMTQVAALKEQLARQQHECRLHHVSVADDQNSHTKSNGFHPLLNGNAHHPSDKGVNGINGINSINGNHQSLGGGGGNKLGDAVAKAAMSLSPRAGRRRIRPASDSDDSYSVRYSPMPLSREARTMINEAIRHTSYATCHEPHAINDMPPSP